MTSCATAPVSDRRPAPDLVARQLTELMRVAAKYGFDPLPNEMPWEAEPEPAEVVLRQHLSHLRLADTVLAPNYTPRPHLGQTFAIDGVPLMVDILDNHPPLVRCILCGGAKGETYTICAGCYTTQLRVAERRLLAVLPDSDERALAGIKPLTHEQFVKAIRRTPRLEPKRRARLAPQAEQTRRHARAAVVEAHRVALLETLQMLAEEQDLTKTERARRIAWLAAAHDAAGWNAGAWERGLAALSIDDYWTAELAAGETEPDPSEEDDEYPVEWGARDWLAAPDRAAFLDEITAPLISRSNVAAGTAQHAAAIQRNELYDLYTATRSRAAFVEGLDEYLAWLRAELIARGGVPSRGGGPLPAEHDADECDRWDSWVDALLGGAPASTPESVDPVDAALCRAWGRSLTAAEDGTITPITLPTIDHGFPSGRLRWPHFVRTELETQYEPWGHWMELDEGGQTVRIWTDELAPHERRSRRRLTRAALRAIRLRQWAKHGPQRGRNKAAPAVQDRPKGTRGEWEREIRMERRRRRFESLAHRNGGIHPTHTEYARHECV